jgi:hypothetical protein
VAPQGEREFRQVGTYAARFSSEKPCEKRT